MSGTRIGGNQDVKPETRNLKPEQRLVWEGRCSNHLTGSGGDPSKPNHCSGFWFQVSGFSVLISESLPVTHGIRLAECGIVDEGSIDLEVTADDVIGLEDAAAKIDGDGSPEVRGGVGMSSEEGCQLLHWH